MSIFLLCKPDTCYSFVLSIPALSFVDWLTRFWNSACLPKPDYCPTLCIENCWIKTLIVLFLNCVPLLGPGPHPDSTIWPQWYPAHIPSVLNRLARVGTYFFDSIIFMNDVVAQMKQATVLERAHMVYDALKQQAAVEPNNVLSRQLHRYLKQQR